MSQRVVLPVQLAPDGAKRLHHDLRAKRPLRLGVSLIIAARSDHPPVGHKRLRVADEHDGEHIHILWVQLAERGQPHLLLRTARLAHISYGSVCLAFLQHQLLQPVELPVAAVRLGVVDGSDEIGLGSGHDATLDDLPGSHQVRQRDDAHVVTHRSAQQRRCLLKRRDAGQRLDRDVRLPFTCHLIYQWSHAVEPCVARRDHHHGLSLLGHSERLLGALTLLLHACVDALAPFPDISLDKLEVVLIAHDHICLPHGLQHCRSDIFFASRPNACHDNLFHSNCKNTKKMPTLQLSPVIIRYFYLFPVYSSITLEWSVTHTRGGGDGCDVSFKFEVLSLKFEVYNG